MVLVEHLRFSVLIEAIETKLQADPHLLVKQDPSSQILGRVQTAAR